MTPARFNRLVGPTLIGFCVMLLTPGSASAQSSETSVPPTTEAIAGGQVDCQILDADVDSGTATFTIGPDDCVNPVGPISFSTYELPSGEILPYAQQVLITHAAGNGSSYGAGTYTLTASLGSALNWQADLYYGDSDDQPPHPRMIDVDAQTGVVAATTTAAPSTAPTTTTAPETTAPAANTPATTEIQVSSLTPSVTVAAPTATVVLAPAPPGGSEVGVAQTTTTTPSVALPQTASSSTAALVAAAGALTVVGWAFRRLTRRPPEYGN